MSRPAPPSFALLALAALLVVAPAPPAASAPGDTTWVRTFDQDFYNWATPHYASFDFPTDPGRWEKVLLYYTIGCPPSPDDCDPWDRLGHLRVVTADRGDVEIARIVTPYDITGPGYPGTCTWEINVSPYKSLLQGEVELRNYIESWIGGTRGWLVTCDFAFIEGERPLEPYRVENLMADDQLIFGDPAQPIEDQIPPVTVQIDPRADKVRVRVFATGHGQGNTANCAEFCSLQHHLVVNGDDYSHFLWRSDCASNPCSPQGGTWTFGRAGWCPGSAADAWNVDITASVTPGELATISYTPDPYVNHCRPDDPDCVDGVTCNLCAYDGGGHTPPHYTLQSQIVYYADRPDVVAADGTPLAAAPRVSLEPNRPNPFPSETRIAYAVPVAGPVTLLVHDLAGRLVREVHRVHPSPGAYSWLWDGTDADGNRVASGAYFATIRAAGEVQSRKMIRVDAR